MRRACSILQLISAKLSSDQPQSFSFFPTSSPRNSNCQLCASLFEGCKHYKGNIVPPVAPGEAGPPARCDHRSLLPGSLSTEGNGSLGVLGNAVSAVNERQDRQPLVRLTQIQTSTTICSSMLMLNPFSRSQGKMTATCGRLTRARIIRSVPAPLRSTARPMPC